MRRGVSLLEVMIALIVVSIGLLAALTVFPVASAIARKGEVADNVAVIGRSAIHDFDTRGMREPARWMAWNQTAGAYQQYSPVFGESYCIDPRGMAANPTAQLAISAFPYSATATQPKMRRLTLDRMTMVLVPPEPTRNWPPPFDGDSSYPGGIVGPVPSGFPMSKPLADSIFVLDDDLNFERPDDASLPGYGTFSNGVRSSGGHYSWMATLTPNLELHGPAAAVTNADYILSVIVFHDRPSDMLAGDPMHERVVHCDFADAGGTGHAGGEVYLTWAAPQTAANDTFAKDSQLHVRGGDWIMLAGFTPHALGGEASVCRWYKVTECDSQPEYHAAEGHYAIAASLSGPDWGVTQPPYQSLYGELNMPGTPPIAVLMSGVVAMYEKSIKLSSN